MIPRFGSFIPFRFPNAAIIHSASTATPRGKTELPTNKIRAHRSVIVLRLPPTDAIVLRAVCRWQHLLQRVLHDLPPRYELHVTT